MQNIIDSGVGIENQDKMDLVEHQINGDALQNMFNREVALQTRSPLLRLTRKMMKSALRMELLSFFRFEELVKLSLISVKMYKFVDPNRGSQDIIQQINFLVSQENDDQLSEEDHIKRVRKIEALESQLSYHLSIILSI